MSWSDLNTHDWFDIALGVISLFGSAVAVMATVYAIRLSGDANLLAKRAIEMQLFTHKREVEPNLTLSWSPIKVGTDLFMQLVNEGRGKAVVLVLQASFKRDAVQLIDPQEMPYELLRNGKASFFVTTNYLGLPELILKQNESVLRNYLKQFLVNQWVKVYYRDMLGTPFEVLFTENAAGSAFVQNVTELNPKDSGFPRQIFKDA